MSTHDDSDPNDCGRTTGESTDEDDDYDVAAVEAQERWGVDENPQFVGMDVSATVAGEEIVGTLEAVWTFRGRARAGRHPGACRWRGPDEERRLGARLPGRVSQTCVRRRGRGGTAFKRSRTEDSVSKRQDTTHPRLTGVRNEGTGRTLPLFSRAHHKRCPREWRRCLTPWRDVRRYQPATSMSITSARSASTLVAQSPTVEEESRRECLPHRGRGGQNRRIATRERGETPSWSVSASLDAFNTLHYCYHTDDTDSDTAPGRATSHVVARSSRVESGGASR